MVPCLRLAGNESTAAAIISAGGSASTYTVDLSDPAQVAAAAKRVRQEVGVVDILVNNAGIVVGKTIDQIPANAIAKVMAVNANAVMWTTNEFLPDMLARERGGDLTLWVVLGFGYFRHSSIIIFKNACIV